MYCASNYGEKIQGRVWTGRKSNGKIKTEKAEINLKLVEKWKRKMRVDILTEY